MSCHFHIQLVPWCFDLFLPPASGQFFWLLFLVVFVCVWVFFFNLFVGGFFGGAGGEGGC